MTSVSAKSLIASVALAAVFFGGCKSRPVADVIGAPIPVAGGKTVSMDDVTNAIVRAGARSGWQVTPEAAGRLSARYNHLQHSAIVEITHDTKTYNIKYRDSANLKADAGEIHKVYNRWVSNLDRSIRGELAFLPSQ